MNYRPQFSRTSALSVSAKHSFEIEVELTGVYQPGYPERGPTYDCGGTPAEPDGVEDLDIADIGILTRDLGVNLGLGHHAIMWRTTSILDGVDRKSEAYQQIVSNILKLIRDEAKEALLAEAA